MPRSGPWCPSEVGNVCRDVLGGVQLGCHVLAQGLPLGRRRVLGRFNVVEALEEHAEVVLHIAHEGCETHHNSLVLIHHRGDVHALRRTLEPHHAEDKLLDGHHLLLVDVEELEEASRLRDIQAQDLQVRHRLRILQHLLQLLAVELARVCVVHVVEDAPHGVHRGVVPLDLVLNDQISVDLRDLVCALHENCGQDVQHAENDERNVEDEDEAIPLRDAPERVQEVMPVSAARYGHEEREHGGLDASVGVYDLLVQRLVLRRMQMRLQHLHDDYGKEVQDESQEDEGPAQRDQRREDGGNHQAKFPHVADGPDNPGSPHGTDGAEASHESHVHEGGQEVHHGACDNEGVKHVPAPVRPEEEAGPSDHHPRHELRDEEHREAEVGPPEPSGRRRVRHDVVHGDLHLHAHEDDVGEDQASGEELQAHLQEVGHWVGLGVGQRRPGALYVDRGDALPPLHLPPLAPALRRLERCDVQNV
mmetsp:Transcript_97872/g.238064  ORF Transcript_97872/g.238064 Transcript_97872/m.238064 type:complete len:476 (-) Transcript_97872:160-1587(-)